MNHDVVKEESVGVYGWRLWCSCGWVSGIHKLSGLCRHDFTQHVRKASGEKPDVR